ncbi:hypothetical protein [Methylobacterium soli]|uniref:Uncharacterized protein n=1 Tax=Methylobacterium soli TaxID=553447 RepID=A0A6L3SQR8_9HYPH|nr:hypothetical protein [Methylobacterium soli]KAB1073851.1 hypothetical protein F6X53_26655 [Methylobacterium soli]GJE46830.1 hypothetical protein AEGHOMDF_6039 [Methylobacterium soli]
MSEAIVHGRILPEGESPSRYRAFILDADQTVLRIEHLPAQDDDAALELARKLLDGRPIELWDGLRFIEHLDPGAEAN